MSSVMPGLILPLKEEAPFCCRHELLSTAQMVYVIAFTLSGKPNYG
jgi:hypothetical protein